MPTDMSKNFTSNGATEQGQDDAHLYAQYYVEDGGSLYDEQEYAYKCDFKKRQPPNASVGNNTTSLLSNLFSSADVPIQSSTKSDHSSQAKPVNISRPTHIHISPPEPLSESLKKNVAWEQAQSPLEKYRNSKKNTTSSESLNDNFSQW